MFRFGPEQRQIFYLAAMLVALPSLLGSPLDYRIQMKVADSAAETSENPQCNQLADEEDQTVFRTSVEGKHRGPRRNCDAAFITWNIADPDRVNGSFERAAALHVPAVKLCEKARHCRSGIQLS